MNKRLVKGISPIIAVLILIGIAIATGLVVWRFVGGASKPQTVVKLDVINKDAVTPPDGSELSWKVTVRNSGTVVLTISKITLEYGGKSKDYAVNKNLSPGASYEFSFTTTKGDLGVAGFAEGSTAKIKITYSDPTGSTNSETEYVTIRTSG